MAVSKVILNGTTLMDVTDKTVAADKLLTGYTALKNDGTAITGIYSGEITPAPFKDVNFFDYDGTILYSYSASEFANLTELPANPTHSGLTAQGWNWTLADAKTQVADTGFLDIGQLYVTSDGKTRIYITLYSESVLNPQLNFYQTVANGVSIDWGDGSSTETASGTGLKRIYHTYSAVGNYCITLTVTSGTLQLGGDSNARTFFYGAPFGAYRRITDKVELGTNASFATNAFYNNFSIRTVTIPSSITTHWSCYNAVSLKCAILPSGVSLNNFRNAYSLSCCSSGKITGLGSGDTFRSAMNLKRFAIPSGVTAIPSYAFGNAEALTKLVIPSTITSIAANAFNGVSALTELHFRPTTPPTVSDSTTFTNLPTDCKIYVPTGKLSNYTTASNYPSSSTYTYIEE